MARTRGNRGDESRRAAEPPRPAPEDEGPAGRIPDLLRRVLALGFSGFFLTEEAVRKALGETLPRDWADFAAEQSQRTRDEFLERLAREVAETLESVDLVDVAERLMAGNAIEVTAQIRFVPQAPDSEGELLKVSLARKGRRR